MSEWWIAVFGRQGHTPRHTHICQATPLAPQISKYTMPYACHATRTLLCSLDRSIRGIAGPSAGSRSFLDHVLLQRDRNVDKLSPSFVDVESDR